MQPPPPPGPPPAPVPSAWSQPYGYGPQPAAWVPPPPVSRRKWWFWGCGGCAALTLIVVALIVFVFLRIFTSSPLRQFPTAAGATTRSDNWDTSGNQTTETLVIADPHQLQDVETYYEQALHANGWTTATHDPAQATNPDIWTVTHTGSSSQSGTVTFSTSGSGTDIQVVFSY